MNTHKATFRPPMNPERKPLHTLLPLQSPLALHIDPSDTCNFRCKFCFQSHTKLKHTQMTLDLFQKIVNDLKEFPVPINTIYLHRIGEPLLNKNFPEFVRILKNARLTQGGGSNWTYCDNHKR